jgi:acyl carrier protein
MACSFHFFKKKLNIKKKCIFADDLKFTIMAEILEKVQSIIAEKLSVDAADVTPEKSFTNDLGADSLDTVELIMEFENVFGIKIPDEETEKIMTVGDAVAYIESQVASK